MFWPLICAVRIYATGEGKKPKQTNQQKQTQKTPKQQQQKIPTNHFQTHPSNQMKALTGCKDEKITTASKPTWPCWEVLLKTLTWGLLIEIFQIFMSPWALLLLITWAAGLILISVLGVFVAFSVLQRNVCFLWQTFILILDTLQFYKKRQKLLCPCWRLIETQKKEFFCHCTHILMCKFPQYSKCLVSQLPIQ